MPDQSKVWLSDIITLQLVIGSGEEQDTYSIDLM